MASKIKYLDRAFQGKELASGNVVIQNSISNDELKIDTLDFVANVQDSKALISSDSYLLTSNENEVLAVESDEKPEDLINYVYGADVTYHHDDELIGKFYMNKVTRTGKRQYSVSCISAIGLLDNSRHYGGVYTGKLMKDVVAEIIGNVVPYTISTQFQNVPIYGWLPIATRRENLQQLLFATGASLKKSVAGAIEIVFLSVKDPIDVSGDRLYIGGDVDLTTPITSVILTEHAFAATSSGELVTLFDGMVAGDSIVSPKGVSYTGTLVTFSEPCHSLSVTGGSIKEQGPNYAVLAQSGYSVLTGKKYVHTTNEITRKPDVGRARAIVDIKDNMATVNNATLVTLANGENVAKRVLAYYAATKEIGTSLVVGTERPGDFITFSDPFDEATTGFIKSMDISISNTLKANATVSVGYAPSDPGNFYKNSILLTGSGSWTPPAGTKKLYAVCIGSGQRGPSGKPGGVGQQGGSSTFTDIIGTSYHRHAGTAGEGGDGAETGGIGGDVYEAEFTITAGQTFSYSAGSGGSGQASIFGSYSSSSGGPRPSGYVDIFTGNVYALKNSTPGKKGGRGTGAENTSDRNARIITGDTIYGPSGATYPGSKGTGLGYSNGGYGGGAAIGQNGYNGQNATGSGAGTPGNGGTGATPVAPAARTGYGEGGDGGHGGGGGGGNGSSGAYGAYTDPASPGRGGSGGPGGPGGPGAILVYY